MKTIKELNRKIWYRIIKVVYILFLLFLLFLWTIIIYDSIKYNIKINEIEYKTLSKEKISEILKNAPESTTDKEIIDWLIKRWYTLEWYKYNNIWTIDIYFTLWMPLSYEKEKYNSYIIFIIWRYYKLILFYIISYLIFFQIINRIFYYIIFWNFNPQNN